MTSTWLQMSALLTCYPDRLKTLKLGGSRSKGDMREEREGGEREG